MKKIALSAFVALASIHAAPSLACDGHDGTKTAMATTTDTKATASSGSTSAKATEAAKPAIKEVTVADLAARLKAVEEKKATLAVYDVNSKETRADKGVIPTAVLLPSAKAFDVAALPKDKAAPVVFYCSSTQCSASKTAAGRAVEAGFTDVSVLPEGIAGWVKAGQPVQKAPNA